LTLAEKGENAHTGHCHGKQGGEAHHFGWWLLKTLQRQGEGGGSFQGGADKNGGIQRPGKFFSRKGSCAPL